jgi:hypothetical protein
VPYELYCSTMRLVAQAALIGVAAAYSNPFCGISSARDAISLSLECAPAAGAISSVTFAAYGTPVTSGGCGAFQRGACDLPGFLSTVQAACLNRTSCTISVDHGTPDPCTDVIKSLAVTAACERAPGGQQVQTWPVVPSCATQNGAPPCPLPAAPWQPTWELSRSTICQPGNVADWLNATQAASFGLISLDWSIAYEQWRPKGTPCNATTGAATLVEQCRRIKAVNPTTKCFVCVCGCSSPAAVAVTTGLHPPHSHSHSARYTFRAQVPQH